VKVRGYELDLNTSDSGKDLTLTPSSAQYTAAAPIEGGVPNIALITDDLIQQVAQNSFPGVGFPDLSVDTFTLENMTHVPISLVSLAAVMDIPILTLETKGWHWEGRNALLRNSMQRVFLATECLMKVAGLRMQGPPDSRIAVS